MLRAAAATTPAAARPAFQGSCAPDPAADDARVEAPTDMGEDAGPDSDVDGMSDSCETSLAMLFAPILMQDRGDCMWSEDADPSRIAGGYHYAVQPAGDRRVRLAYLPGYLRDCGWRGPKCLLPGVDCRPHAGDSEAIIVEAEFDRERDAWSPTAVFLSAHCFDGESDACRWHEGAELDDFDWRGAGPVVWVASGRHANYPSDDACDAGHYWLDDCGGDALAVAWPVMADRNVGSAEAPIGGDGCVSLPEELDPSLVAAGAIECFWSERPFRGWQGDAHPGVTPYRRYLDLMESR